MSADAAFLEQLRATFKIEAAEHLQAIAVGLVELEKPAGDENRRVLLETMFRAAHSLKGAARAVDFADIESWCHALEDTFATWKRQGRAPGAAEFDLTHHLLDSITSSLAGRDAASGAGAAVSVPASRPEPAHPSAPIPKTSAKASPKTAFLDEGSVRISIEKLDARLVEAEEMLNAKLAAGQRAENLRELAASFSIWNREWSRFESGERSLRAMLERSKAAPAVQFQSLDLRHSFESEAARLLEFLNWNLEFVHGLENRVAGLSRKAEQDLWIISKLVDELLENSKKLLLLPFSSLSSQFPKIVRDLCRDEGKEADLTVQGEDVEIDKRILEEMKDPITHLIRNCVDHGIETAEVRLRSGKPPRGAITLAAWHASGGKVEILIADDGAGLDLEKLKESAVKNGILSPERAAQMTDEDARALVFQPEISTSQAVTRLSGRGLGLAIVREKAEKLGGTVSIESTRGKGACFRILLPSMLATFRGVPVEAGGRAFVLPTAQIIRAARVRADEVRTVEGRETVSLHGQVLALVELAEVLQLDRPGPSASREFLTVIVLGSGEQQAAFAVDSVLNEQEVLVKRFQRPLARIRNIAGATLLGSGQLTPVLNPADLIKSARAATGTPRSAPTAAARPSETKSILVAEDSITSRMLLKSILESAGYRVRTAVDGLEAFMLLRSEKFHLVVTDVEMPRLNGFDLTARIRADKKLAELPVILVTGLEKREHRERGVDVGASAYLVKQSFDQSNLLETVQRFI
jgi:two-component system chemotaxis sensor kinase CheA